MRHSLVGVLALAAFLPAIPAQAQDPAAAFAQKCSACHGPDGGGIAGLAPPLNRPDFWQALGSKANTYIAGVMVSGLAGSITAGGETYAGLVMPPVSGPDDELAAAATHVLTNLGNLDSGVDASAVAEARKAKPSHADLRAMRPGS